MNRILLTLPLFLSACAVLHGDGTELSELREIDDLEGVRNTTQIDVAVELGLDQSVEVVCDENLVEHILTEVDDGTLVIRTPPGVLLQPTTDCYVYVTAPGVYELDSSGSGGLEAWGAVLGLREVHNSGSGSLEVEGIETDTVEVDNSGSGGIQLAGVAGFADLHDSGSGDIDAEGLVCDGATIHNSGSGDISVTVNGAVDLRLSGSGNVELYGDPSVTDQTDSGSGDVILH